MQKLSYEDFYSSYHKYHRLPMNMYVNRNKTLSDTQLKQKYFEYERKIEKAEDKFKRDIEKSKQKQKEKYEEIKENGYPVDEKWETLKLEVYNRDKGKCWLLSKLHIEDISNEVRGLLKSNTFNQVDPAHIFSKGVYPKLKYELDNVITLTRLFHSNLDSYKNPLTGKPIDREEHRNWWIFIVGREQYERLEKIAR